MIIKLTSIFFCIFYIFFSNVIYALTSSSYLISNIAFKNNDFERATFESNNLDKNLNLTDYENNLISLINLYQFESANNAALKILQFNKNHQEALIANLAYKLKKNNKLIYDSNNNFDKNDLIKYIFFEKENFKSNKEISIALLEVVEVSLSNVTFDDEINFNFLLFYLSLSTYLDERNNKSWFLIGQLYQIMNKFEKAEFYYNKINPSSSYYIDSEINIAINYSEYLSFNQAEKKIKELIKKSLNKNDLYKILADFYRVNNKYEIAIKYYSDLIIGDGKELWKLFYLRGICFERLDKWKQAEKDFTISLEINSNSPDVLNYLAYSWIEKNINIDRSISMLESAYESNPNSYYILDSLAWGYFKKNELEYAAELMEKVIEMAPGEAISLDHLGDIYSALNRNREAIFFWKQAIDLANPEDNITEKIIKKLELHVPG